MQDTEQRSLPEPSLCRGERCFWVGQQGFRALHIRRGLGWLYSIIQEITLAGISLCNCYQVLVQTEQYEAENTTKQVRGISPSAYLIDTHKLSCALSTPRMSWTECLKWKDRRLGNSLHFVSGPGQDGKLGHTKNQWAWTRPLSSVLATSFHFPMLD